MGKSDLALADFNEAVEHGSDQPVTWRARGEFYLDENRFAEAAQDFTQALGLNSKDAKALYYRSEAKRGLGDGPGAAADLALAKLSDPQVEEHLETMAHAHSYVQTQ